ncbi:MAG: LysR substrate-binding domain-containing protein [Hyphomonadaceae bacterium]
MRRRLPSLNAVRAFEAAARRRSLTAAARELNVTPGAISRHVALLEGYFGCQLLAREQRGVTPTAKGEAYFKAVAGALDAIDAASRELGARRAASALVVQLYTALAVDWVAPRIERFHAAHPDIDVRMVASPSPAPDFEDVDLAGVLGEGEVAGLSKEFVFQARFAPVCAPALLAKKPKLKRPEEIASFRLLSAAPEANFWRRWFEAAGVTPPARGSSQIFESASLADQAARRGAGFAMGNIVILADDLAAGRLVAPFPMTVSPLPSYWLACAKRRANEPAIAAFRQWLIGEMRENQAAHAKLLGKFKSLIER